MFIKTRYGGEALMVGGHKFYKNNRIPRFTKSRYGKPVIQIGMYRFNRNNRSHGLRALWTCSRIGTGCKANITTIEDTIVKLKLDHNH
ncbi:unnamed protein product [Colias eurytheme]|nr:unnamed protein product [Colias eurytheme]